MLELVYYPTPLVVGSVVELNGMEYKVTRLEGSVANLTKMVNGKTVKGRPLKVTVLPSKEELDKEELELNTFFDTRAE